MKKRILFYLQIVALVFFIISFVAAVLPISGSLNPIAKIDHQDAVYNHIEAFDPSLSRLNTLRKLELYCDSIYAETVFSGKPVEFEKSYTDIASTAVRNRFFHGYSYYSVSDNYVAALISKFTIPGLDALVIPDDILKHPYAACSQQSIVMMEVLKAKGFSTRKITFSGKKFGGHFAFEVFYTGTWHFHDPNMEPDKVVLNAYGRPGIDFLVRNPEILENAYRRYPKEMIMDIFNTYSYGPVNKFPAAKAMIFQKVTQFLTYSVWIVFLILFVMARRKYRHAIGKTLIRRRMVVVPGTVPEVASVMYPTYTAHGT